MLRFNTKFQSNAKRTEVKLRRDQRQRTFKFSLAIAVPLALLMAATFIGLKATTPENATPLQTQTSPQGTQSPQLEKPSETGGVSPKPTAGVTTHLPSKYIELPAPSSERHVSQTEQDPVFKLDDIATALSRIKLDDDGQILVDRQVRTVLEAAFMQPKTPVDETRFEELKTLIAGGLDGEAGQQAAAMAERFYRYSNAYREVADTFGHHGALQNVEADFEQLSRLRRTYLGDELSDSLYGEEEALMRYTLQSMRIQTDGKLSPEQKQVQQEQLRKRVPSALLGAPEQASPP
ncbi:hypothetical protein RE428_33940 [Marinobacter nanhaiticus D15-8W]|uniref:Lipase chaperone n=1 Tax=Marinobacter nanhaiticus D15-8W TaxID=626887 RepID=N6W8I9_9GAMM|nr:lipase chaperone [Marinobacter nanhaiticus]ENO16579.1 hypothetical protein J057_02695 [Marinobacter nanhaiticus D15-8W]BES72376.1 hypothetical protein RE428_33940 [Marinobacter nanhaiticus D15-8W]